MCVIKNKIMVCVVDKVGFEDLKFVFVGFIVVVFFEEDLVVFVKILVNFVKIVDVF